jgi:DNA-binding NarL/FixJ family response regulator
LFDTIQLTRDCLCAGLNAYETGLRVEAIVDTAQLDSRARDLDPIDVTLYNIGTDRLGTPHALATIQALRTAAPQSALVIITNDDAPNAVTECLRLGVKGFIVTTTPLEVLVHILRLVSAGGTFVPASALTQPPPSSWGMRIPGGPTTPLSLEPTDGLTVNLTPRQRAVFDCLRQGKPNKVIAHELGMCESTVKVHVRNVLSKLGATNRTQAAYLIGSHSLK